MDLQTEAEIIITSSPSKTSSDQSLAAELIEVLPQSMNAIRCYLRSSRGPELTVPQFRVLIHLREGKNTNKFLAEKLGVSVPAMSRMVSALTERGLIVRSVCRDDRRENHIKLTHAGLSLVDETRHRATEKLAKKIAELSEADKNVLKASCKAIHDLFR